MPPAKNAVRARPGVRDGREGREVEVVNPNAMSCYAHCTVLRIPYSPGERRTFRLLEK